MPVETGTLPEQEQRYGEHWYGEHWYGEPALFVRYLIGRHERGRLAFLTFPAGDGLLLPVFSDEHAVRAFLRLGGLGGWQAKEFTAGELISLLTGQAEEVEKVVLNPPSGLVTGHDLSVEGSTRRDFIDSLMDEPLLLPHGARWQ